eukprot:gene1857-6492_t
MAKAVWSEVAHRRPLTIKPEEELGHRCRMGNGYIPANMMFLLAGCAVFDMGGGFARKWETWALFALNFASEFLTDVLVVLTQGLLHTSRGGGKENFVQA